MNILALDFSSAQRSAAVLCTGPSGGRESRLTEVIEAATVGGPFEMIEAAIRQSGIDREQVDRIGVGLGPGSYTGIRSALAVVQGWHLARPVGLVGISSAAAIAAQAQADGLRGAVSVVIDAQRNEIYLADYELTGEGCREQRPLRLAPLAETLELGDRLCVGPEVTRWIPAGKVVYPRAGWVARLAVRALSHAVAEALEPIYLRETTFVKAPPPRQVE